MNNNYNNYDQNDGYKITFDLNDNKQHKIPKIIHQLWLQSEKYAPELFKKYTEKTKELNSNFTYIFWDESKILELIKDNTKYMKTYYAFTYMHQKIDYARYIILYTYGGIFIDMDAYTIKKLDSLYELVDKYDVVLSYLPLNILEATVACGKKKCVNNGIILSKPKTDFMRLVINFITNNYECGSFTSQVSCITNTTGPVFLDKMIDKYKGVSNIKILESEYLEPCIKNKCNITKNSYILHKHTRTWVPKHMKVLHTFYFNNKIIIYIAIVILIIFIIYKFILN
jgi:inositol phosphorylceramide mannosyltransferase catalytic subunit